MTLYLGDCLEIMKNLDDNSIDSVITDSPYGLKFMGKDWDKGVPGIAFWKEALRVAKPGAILMAFGGTRTVHRLACAIEDAGWEIRDRMQWLNGQGFPKSHNISKAIDKKANKEREVIGKSNINIYKDNKNHKFYSEDSGNPKYEKGDITAPATEEAKLWDGWGTALKPSHEPIIVAMKPIEGTYVENALKWGVAGLWIEGGTIATEGRPKRETRPLRDDVSYSGNSLQGRVNGSLQSSKAVGTTIKGRWPANVLHDGSNEVLAEFPQSKGAQAPVKGTEPSRTGNRGIYSPYGRVPNVVRGDTGSSARFFYCAKASKKERNMGLDGDQNKHPTVKPLALMRYLCRLTKTPTGGIVLDPFMGSGTTGMAAMLEGRDFIGIEQDKDHFQIAKKRIAHAKESDG